MTPNGLAFFMRILEAKRLHLLGRSVFLTTGVVDNEKNDSSGIFELCFPNSVHDRQNPSALHTIHTPWRMIQEIRNTAQMTAVFGSVLNLCDILASSTENDAMDQSKQMPKLRFRKFQLQR
nr:hypothetical protein [Paenibacillus elgii]